MIKKQKIENLKNLKIRKVKDKSNDKKIIQFKMQICWAQHVKTIYNAMLMIFFI